MVLKLMRALPGMNILMILLLSPANAMLYKVREFLNTRVLKSIYHAPFYCHLNYAYTNWG